ncbi:MAG: N-acetylglucosamine-6-phosphate deacetylase [Promethearchaeati archaeon SRVP18_Atabeyarchaeia-1]
MPIRGSLPKVVSSVENATIVTLGGLIEGGSIIIRDGRIAEILRRDSASTEQRGSANRIDARDKIVVPGMIDIHTHGVQGGSALDSKAESIRKMCKHFPSHGVTGFLPTTCAEPRDVLVETARSVAEIIREGAPASGAQVLGLNLEGPFISKVKPGAQPPSFIRDPSFEEFEEICEASGENVKLITVAPELKGSLEFIRRARAKGVVIAAGHSNATYDEMIAGIGAGITHASHTYNAMREFKHRDPGMLAAILTNDEVTAELIADNVHVHEGAMKLLIKAKGVGRIVAVSDSMPLAGMPDGEYDLMGFKIKMKNQVLTLPGGQLAGSGTTLEKSMRVMTVNLGIPLSDAVLMTATNPARIIGIGGSKGSIEEGKDADLAILNKEDLSVHATIIKGQVAYQRSY